VSGREAVIGKVRRALVCQADRSQHAKAMSRPQLGEPRPNRTYHGRGQPRSQGEGALLADAERRFRHDERMAGLTDDVPEEEVAHPGDKFSMRCVNGLDLVLAEACLDAEPHRETPARGVCPA